MRKFSLFHRPRKSHVNDEGIDGYDWDESQPKWPAVRIFNTTLGVISVIVWIVLFFRLFVFSPGTYNEMILLDEKGAGIYPQKTNQVLRVHSNTDEDGKSGLVVLYPVYLEETENFQLTAQINRRVLKPGKGDVEYTFVLRESGGEETRFFEVSYGKTQKKLNYSFHRICFNDVVLDENKVYTLLVYTGLEKGKDGVYEGKEADFTFTVLNSDTYCNTTTPDKDIYSYVIE